MLELIEIELTRVRRMPDQADDGFLVYLIDMAIIEANAKARSRDNGLETLIPRSTERSALAEDAANAHSLRRESGEQGRPDA